MKMFVTAVCFLFLLKLKWPKDKSIYDDRGVDDDDHSNIDGGEGDHEDDDDIANFHFDGEELKVENKTILKLKAYFVIFFEGKIYEKSGSKIYLNYCIIMRKKQA